MAELDVAQLSLRFGGLTVLVLAHLVRRAGSDAGPLESDVATILRVESDAITEIVTVSSRALDTYWSTA